MILEFLATTLAERRPRVQEQEQEGWRRSRDEAWQLDEESQEDGKEEKKGNKRMGSEVSGEGGGEVRGR